jgi:hypothetical protein
MDLSVVQFRLPDIRVIEKGGAYALREGRTTDTACT